MMGNNSVELLLAHVTVAGRPLAGPIGLGRAGNVDDNVEAKHGPCPSDLPSVLRSHWFITEGACFYKHCWEHADYISFPGLFCISQETGQSSIKGRENAFNCLCL